MIKIIFQDEIYKKYNGNLKVLKIDKNYFENLR